MAQSELNKDRERLEDRKNPLTGYDVPLRDQINEKLYQKCIDLDVAQKVVTLWYKGSANRVRWLERQKAYLASWDEHLVGNTEGSFEGSSQLHIPMPFIVCKTLHARYLQALWQDPPFNVKARNEASMDREQTVSDVLRYFLMDGANYNKGIEAEVDTWVWRWITSGSGIMKMAWECKYTRFVDVKEVPVRGKPSISTDENGKDVVIPTVKMKETEVAVTKKIFDGPLFRRVDVEDLLIIGGNGDTDLAEAVIEQDFPDASQLWTLSDRKIFKEEAVRKVIESGNTYPEGTINADLKIQKEQNAGKSRIGGDQDHDRYQILEAYLKMDVDDSGIDADIVVWIHLQSKELLRATYLHRISPDGTRPYAKADFIIREGQDYGVGMPELLYPLSQEMDAIHNMRIDFGLISVMPFGFYRASSGIDPETIKLEPGALIPVDNPQGDVFFPNLGNRTVFGMQEEQALQSIVERLTSISDLNLGMMQGQGATRTATGARALVGEMSSNLDVFLRRLNRGWKKALRYTLHLLQKKVSPGLSFRITGDDGQDYWAYINDQKDVAGDFDIEVSPNSATSNPQVKQENADYVLQLCSNPLAIQMGMVSPGQFYEAAKGAMLARGIKDFGKFLQKPQGYHRQLSPEEEGNRLLRGIDVPVLPDMDHQGFIDWFQHVHDTDELAGFFSQDEFIKLAQQAKKHEQMLQALQHQQAQQANAAQMSRNAQMGAQMSPQAAPAAGAAPAQAPAPTAPPGGPGQPLPSG